jgi:hypothetical protein
MMAAMSFGAWAGKETNQSNDPQETGPMPQPNRGRHLEAFAALPPNLVPLGVDG